MKHEIQTLSTSEQKMVFDYLCLLRSESEKQPRGYDRDLEMWVESVGYQYRRIVKADPPPYRQSEPLRKAVMESFKVMMGFLNISGLISGPMESYNRKALYELLARLLVVDSRHVAIAAKAPITLKFIYQRTHTLPGLFDSAFPGYLESGQASLLMKYLQSNARSR